MTVVTPDIVNEFWETLSTLAKEGIEVEDVGSVYWTIFPTVAIPIKNLLGSVLVTVEIPADAPDVGGSVILTSPIVNKLVCLTSALKVLAVLTVPLIDLISLVVYAVAPAEIFPLSTPLNINCSPVIKVPLVLYMVTAVELLTAFLKYPVAPLDLPLIWVGIERDVGVFKATSVYGWISYKAISHSLRSALDAS